MPFGPKLHLNIILTAQWNKPTANRGRQRILRRGGLEI